MNSLPEDGMDQSKWAVPRCQQLTKTLAKHERPRAKLQGVWMHNVALCMYALDVRQATDGSMVVEALARSLEKMWAICRQRGRPGPKRILIWVLWLYSQSLVLLGLVYVGFRFDLFPAHLCKQQGR